MNSRDTPALTGFSFLIFVECNDMTRYQICTIDGSVIKTAETVQQVGDYVAQHLAQNMRPHIGYSYDQHAETAFPYTCWQRDDCATIGHPQKTFDDVVNWWKTNK